jgi:hypothetical protein
LPKNSITPKTPLPLGFARDIGVIAFHEKAGRSQVSSCVFLLDKAFLPPSSR